MSLRGSEWSAGPFPLLSDVWAGAKEEPVGARIPCKTTGPRLPHACRLPCLRQRACLMGAGRPRHVACRAPPAPGPGRACSSAGSWRGAYLNTPHAQTQLDRLRATAAGLSSAAAGGGGAGRAPADWPCAALRARACQLTSAQHPGPLERA